MDCGSDSGDSDDAGQLRNVSDEEGDALLGEASSDSMVIRESTEPICGCPFNPIDHVVWCLDEAGKAADDMCCSWANP